ncbi:MAG: GYD domain-containing protein [Armatimonadetes bacterium]|nr:GYD domain-containing protein [Armatimonadota bacterium]MBI2972942.1 GYD domain-containing protein [Armatimonadota bacterium]
MPKYLFTGSYSTEGLKGLLSDGGTKRRDVAKKAVESVGGRLEEFYFAFGDTDVVGIADVPDNVSVAAISLAISATGAFNFKTTVLLTPEEMDQATRKEITYSPPGR